MAGKGLGAFQGRSKYVGPVLWIQGLQVTCPWHSRHVPATCTLSARVGDGGTHPYQACQLAGRNHQGHIVFAALEAKIPHYEMLAKPVCPAVLADVDVLHGMQVMECSNLPGACSMASCQPPALR